MTTSKAQCLHPSAGPPTAHRSLSQTLSLRIQVSPPWLQVVGYIQEKFNAILPGQSGPGEWRAKAQHLLIHSSCLTADDVDNCPNLLATDKQGVGIDKIDPTAYKARGIKIFNTHGVNARAIAKLALAPTSNVARCAGSINADRGGIVNEADLEIAVKEGIIGG